MIIVFIYIYVLKKLVVFLFDSWCYGWYSEKILYSSSVQILFSIGGKMEEKTSIFHTFYFLFRQWRKWSTSSQNIMLHVESNLKRNTVSKFTCDVLWRWFHPKKANTLSSNWSLWRTIQGSNQWRSS